MFAQANQTHFSLSIEGVEHDLQVLEFSGREAISQPYAFAVELISERPDLDWKACCTSVPSSPSTRAAPASTASSTASPRANPVSASPAIA